MTETVRLVMVGFGNVGKAFARLLLNKDAELLERYQLKLLVTGICTRSHGSAIDPRGLDLQAVLKALKTGGSLSGLDTAGFSGSALDFIGACEGDVLLESTPVNPKSGQPAIAHLEAGLRKGMHAVTPNKGPVVFGYQHLTALAESHGKKFLFESTVMDGAPIFSLFRKNMALAELKGFTGVLNSCTNLLIGRMEDGESFAQALDYARSIGITETDPSNDVDGWDAAIKVSALATVLMKHPLTPAEVQPTGIRGITPEKIAEARAAGKRWKLVCSAGYDEQGQFFARVCPEMVGPESPFYSVWGTDSIVVFNTDVLPGLGVLETKTTPYTTAYGLLSDVLSALRD
ncbi:MAG: homoserine dehydrogenase [Anaerolineaceae bacterium]